MQTLENWQKVTTEVNCDVLPHRWHRVVFRLVYGFLNNFVRHKCSHGRDRRARLCFPKLCARWKWAPVLPHPLSLRRPNPMLLCVLWQHNGRVFAIRHCDFSVRPHNRCTFNRVPVMYGVRDSFMNWILRARSMHSSFRFNKVLFATCRSLKSAFEWHVGLELGALDQSMCAHCHIVYTQPPFPEIVWRLCFWFLQPRLTEWRKKLQPNTTLSNAIPLWTCVNKPGRLLENPGCSKTSKIIWEDYEKEP